MGLLQALGTAVWHWPDTSNLNSAPGGAFPDPVDFEGKLFGLYDC